MICPYCSQPAILTDSAEIYGGINYGMIWLCRPCNAYVGTHKGTDRPLGTLANAELRFMRKLAHGAFDRLWKQGRMTRTEAYKHLQQVMGLTAEQAHVGMFDESQCRLLLERLQEIS